MISRFYLRSILKLEHALKYLIEKWKDVLSLNVNHIVFGVIVLVGSLGFALMLFILGIRIANQIMK